MYVVKTNWLLRNLYAPGLTWSMPTHKRSVYLTFDDGPHPAITPFVLDALALHNAKATFFCIGNNVEKNSEVYTRLLSEGHSVGNHTYNHINGWKANTHDYISEVSRTASLVHSHLFRPPYGRISRAQARLLRQHYRIVMWDVLSADFDEKISAERCFNNVIKNVRSGSIVVMHDSEKAFPRLEHALPKVLLYLTENNFAMEAIPQY